MGRWLLVAALCSVGPAACGAKSGLSQRPVGWDGTSAEDARIPPPPRPDGGEDDASFVDSPDATRPDAHVPPIDGGRSDEVVQVTAGWHHSCALFLDGTAACWGNGESGRLGDGSGRPMTHPVLVRNLDDAVQISAGLGHTCALRAGGRILCWGDNAVGQIGDRTTETRYLPATVAGIEDATRISAGGTHNCAIVRGGRVVCWGHDGFSQLGAGEEIFSGMRFARDVIDAVDIAAGHQHTCALQRDGVVLCWGRIVESHSLDVPTRLDTGLRDVASGRFQWCGVGTGGEVRCRREIRDAVSVNVGDGFGCAVRTGGAVRCWGANEFGQLGDDNVPFPSDVSVPVVGLSDAILVSGSYEHTCATRRSGPPVCWGRNEHHQVSPVVEPAQGIPVPIDFSSLSGRADAGTR